jgi:hypothetical protein
LPGTAVTARDELTGAWADWQDASLYRRWARANPGEAARLDAYRASGVPGSPPVLATATGRALVHEATAWLLTGAPAPPPDPDPLAPPPRPAFTPARRVVCGTQAEFLAAYAAIRPGDLLDVRGVQFSGQLNLHARLPDWAEIHFDAACRLVGPSAPDLLHAAWVKASHQRVYGGDLRSPRGTAVRFEDCDHVTWWDGYAHDNLRGGVFVTAVSRDNVGLDVHFRVVRGATSSEYDPHSTEPGSGTHAVYVGGRYQSAALTTRDSRFRFDVSDQPFGAAVQAGEQLDNCELWVRAHRVTMRSQVQYAGNALQMFGDLHDVDIRYVEGADLAGLVVQTGTPGGNDGLYTSASGIRVHRGVAVRTNQNPAWGTDPFRDHPAVTYLSTQP